MLTYVHLGDSARPPSPGRLLLRPRSAPDAASLYRARVAAASAVDTEFMCLMDGEDDEYLPGYADNVAAQLGALHSSGACVAYSDTYRNEELLLAGEFSPQQFRRTPQMMHGPVVCRTSAVKDIVFPDGCFWFEAICYGSLAPRGYVYTPGAWFIWHPTPNGASSWPDTVRAVVNSLTWLNGGQGVHFPKDLAGGQHGV